MENVYIILQQILLESPEFCRRYYRKHFGLFFSSHTVKDTVESFFLSREMNLQACALVSQVE